MLTVDRGRYTCLVGGADLETGHEITAMRARELGRRAVVVGDRVSLVGDTSGSEGSLARIVRIAERTSVLRRTADDTDPTERIVVANAELLVIVCAVADPPPRTGFVDRCLVAAYAGGLEPLLCLTKTDLADPAEFAAHYVDLGLGIVPVRRDEAPADLRERLAGRSSVLFGHSGVGKSTMVNALVPDADRAIGVVSGVGKGRHTSSSVVTLQLPGGGWVIDTPGVRSLGLAHVSPGDTLAAFPELLQGTVDCPPGCTHTSEADGCALDEWVRAGHAGATGERRLASLRRLNPAPEE